MRMQVFQSMDEVQSWILSKLLTDGEDVSPRTLLTKELRAVQFTLARPRARWIQSKARKWSLAAALGEFSWHAVGERDLQQLAFYFPRWTSFSDDGIEVRGSCYGWRIFHGGASGESQWRRSIELLRADLATRRAVLTLYDPSLLLDADTKDSPCAIALQFLVRDGRLDAIGSMRSNDAIWGLPYDVFLFTMLQELMASELDLELGSYTHFAGSMHVYEHHFALARRIVAEPVASCSEMQPIDQANQLQLFLISEAELRAHGTLSIPPTMSRYWTELLRELKIFVDSRNREALPH